MCLNLRTTIEVIWPWVWNRITRFSVANLSSCNTENRKFVETLCNDLCFFGKRLHDRCHQKMLFRKNLLFLPCVCFSLFIISPLSSNNPCPLCELPSMHEQRQENGFNVNFYFQFTPFLYFVVYELFIVSVVTIICLLCQKLLFDMLLTSTFHLFLPPTYNYYL